MASQARFLLTEDLKANLRFAENFARHKTYLLEIDRKRFRGLGEAYTQGFVRHAIGLADHLRFPYIEDTQYIMFVMTFLGSYFYEDPRYKPLADTLALARADVEPDRRIAPGVCSVLQHLSERRFGNLPRCSDDIF